MNLWEQKIRCKICTDERAVRFCLRSNKDIGWKCCNHYRSDGKCPEPCPHTPKQEQGQSPLSRVKTDSRAEFLDFLDRQLQFWMHTKVTPFGNYSPYEMAQDPMERQKLTDWLSEFNYPDFEIQNLLNKKLGLNMTVRKEPITHPEILVARYLDAAIAQDWDKVMAFHLTDIDIEEKTRQDLKERLAKHPVLSKIKSWNIIASGLAEDKVSFFSWTEINNKEDWCFFFKKDNNEFVLEQVIWGSLQDYYDQSKIFDAIAVALSKLKYDFALKHLDKADKVYPLSAELLCHRFVYSAMQNQHSNALELMQQCAALNRDKIQLFYRMGVLYLGNQLFGVSRLFWEIVLEETPRDMNAYNNIGFCLMQLDQPEEAVAIWNKALEIEPNAAVIKKNLEHYAEVSKK
ncbi:MAG: tetratricopeptide repeat protein [Candidatus Cloacimonadaceae bacterium]